jgi:amidohydrolase
MTELAGPVREALRRSEPDAIAVRRELHRHPELSHQEQRTADFVASRCEEMGFEVRTGVAGTGVIADLEGRGSGPTLMLRADMDALPVRESADGRAVRSEIDGVMHACGHDGHVAMALAAGATLDAVREQWRGSLRLCFQPAEEVAEGAAPMIEAGAADGVDRVLGIHLWAPLQVGRVAVMPGVVFGSADLFTIAVAGRGGHGGMPHTAVDPVVAAAHLITALQSIVSRETSPFSPAVVTIGRVSGGTANNVIADSVEIGGTVRAVDRDERERLLHRVAEVARDVARASRCEAHFHRTSGTPPVVSDAGVASVVRGAAVAAVGEDNVEATQPLTVGDDVALFLERVPGCYYLVGAGHPERGVVAPHHSAGFDIDEGSLAVGTETLVRSALQILG